jgi:hypothetical protein
MSHAIKYASVAAFGNIFEWIRQSVGKLKKRGGYENY